MKVVQFISEFIPLFVNSKKALNLSNNSIMIYERVLERFYEFVVSESENNKFLKIDHFNSYFIDKWIIELRNKNLSESSLQLYLITIKQFLQFIGDHDIKKYGFLKTNIRGNKIKVEQKIVKVFTNQEQEKIISLINTLDRSKLFRDHRNSLLLKILLFHGVRISELLNLKWSNVQEICDEKSEYLYKFNYMGKGSKEREIYFPIQFVDLNFEKIKKHIESEYVIPSYSGNKYDRASASKTLKLLLKNQGISNVWAHKFRHTFGTNKQNQGININIIQELMGHANIATTAKFYLRNNEAAKKKAIMETLPNFYQK